jgi:predicted  nucleic acid-binding Zn-ribbon protein
MKKSFLNAVLIGSLLAVPAASFVSCDDYDDDIQSLQAQINALGGTTVSTDALEAKLSALDAQIATLNTAKTSLESELSAAKTDANTAAANALSAAQSAQAAAQTAAQAAQGAQGTADAAAAAASAAQAKADQANSDLQTALQRVATLEAKVSSLETAVSELKSAKDAANTEIAAIKDRLNSVENKAAGAATAAELTAVKNELATQITALESSLTSQLSAVGARIDQIDTKLNQIESTYVSKSDLQTQINAVNQQAAALQAAIDANTALINGINTTISALSAKDAELAATIAANYQTLADQIAAVNADLTTAKASIESLKATVTSLQSAVVTLNSEKANQSALDALSAELKAADTQLQQQITNLKNDLGSATDNALNITALKQAMESAQADIQALVAKDAELLAQINQKADATDVAAKYAELKADVAAASAAASAELAAKAEELNTAIKANADAIAKLNEDLGKKVDQSAYDAFVGKLLGDATDVVLSQSDLVALKGRVDNLDIALAALDAKTSAADSTAAVALKDSVASVLGALSDSVTVLKNAIAALQGISNEQINVLRSLVFKPELYYNGIPGQRVNRFVYKAYTLAKANANSTSISYVGATVTGGSTDAQQNGKSVDFVPIVNFQYHLNPSTADISRIAGEKYLVSDLEYTRASSTVDIVTDHSKISAANGVLTVPATIQNSNKLKTVSDNDQVTVAALQVNYGDTLITSDYAALVSQQTKDFALAFAAQTTDSHLYTTVADAIKNDAQLQVNYDGTIDLAKQVQTHYSVNNGSDRAWDVNAASGTVEESGFAYNYELIGFTQGANATSESVHAALQGSILRPQTPDSNGTQQAYGADQSRSTIGRTPLVRVSLIDNNNGGLVVAVGYIKLKITEQVIDVNTPDSVLVTVDPIAQSTNNFVLKCTASTETVKVKWNDVEHQIFTQLGISQKEFEDDYALDVNNGEAIQYNRATTDATAVTTPVGTVTHTQTDSADPETNVLVWTVGSQQAYQLFLNQNEIKVIVRFTKSITVGTKTVKQYVYVTLLWRPANKYLTPSGKIENTDKIPEYWYAANTDNAGLDDIHVNVDEKEKSNADITTFAKVLENVFKGDKITIKGINSVYTDQQDANLTKDVIFASTQTSPVYGASGTKYYIKVAADAKSLVAGTTQSFAVASGVKVVEITDGTDGKHTISYADTDAAKDILNNASHSELASGKTFTAKLQINASNCPDVPFKLENNTFNVKFLRPINVTDPGTVQFTDAQGDTTAVDLTFTDWRDLKFADDTWFTYYGVTAIEADVPNITTTLGGGTLGTTKLTTITTSVDFEFVAPSAPITAENLGKLVYHNNNATVRDFKIRVPLKITYAWGVLYSHVDCSIVRTLNNKPAAR